MRKATLLTLLTITALMPVSAAGSTQESPEKSDTRERRVVRVVTDPNIEIHENRDFVFIGGDGEHKVHLEAFAFSRGGFIGVQLVDLTPELLDHFGVDRPSGVMISAVSADGPAAEAGVEVGDIVTRVDEEPIAGSSELARIVRGREAGDHAGLEIWRDGRRLTLTATIAERERPQIDVGKFLWKGDDENLQELEVRLDDLPESIIRIDSERWNAALSDLYTKFDSPEFKSKIKVMTEERAGMEKRIRELEGKLEELEKKLSQLTE